MRWRWVWRRRRWRRPRLHGGRHGGLTGTGLVLLDNGGDATKGISADGAFTFTTQVAYGMAYNVTVKTQPSSPSKTCIVTGGDNATGGGTMGYANVTSIKVNCV